MSSFYSVALIEKGKKDTVLKVAKEIEGELKSTYRQDSWFRLRFLGTSEYFDEYAFSCIRLKENYQSIYSKFSEKINGIFSLLETSDGENTNFFLFYRGDLVVRISNNYESEYNSDFFYNQSDVINNKQLSTFRPFDELDVGALERIFSKHLDIPYYELCDLLKINNSENEVS